MLTTTPHETPLRVTAKGTDLTRYIPVEIPLMAPETSLVLCIDDAGLARIGVAVNKTCTRACCASPMQSALPLEGA
jgi:hypothetical protein